MYRLGIFLSVVSLVQGQRGPCFEFLGHTFLEFKPNNFNNSDVAHYSLMLRTKSPEGVVMYSEGPDDYEALFLSQGKLVYLLTNPSPSGVEGTSGGLYISNQEVNNGSWLAVDVWRNWETPDKYRVGRGQLKTGLQIRDVFTGLEESHLDDLRHRGVVLNNTVYFGGVISTALHTKGSASPEFVGRIKHIYEERNHVDFKTYSLNRDGKATLCS